MFDTMTSVPAERGSFSALISSGLQAQYFKGRNLDTPLLIRTDAGINFDWGSSSPDAAVPTDNFSVRWSGQVKPQYSETYTFYTTGDDGVRLWVNGQLLLDNWIDQIPTEKSGSLAMTAGQTYDIRMEYYENGGEAVAKLSWSSLSQAKEIISQNHLISNSVVAAPSAPQMARSAYSFVDSVGVNTHLRYYDTAYGNYSLIKQRLQELGVRHIRDGGSDPTWIQRVNDLASSGIRSTIVLDPNIGVAPNTNSSYGTKSPGYTIQ
jgi:hypothetical protein